MTSGSNPRFNTDEGIILKKTKLLNENLLLIIFAKKSGKIVLSAFGVRNIKSKRLSHLEIGNYIRFSYRENKDGYLYLAETELSHTYSKIKEDQKKLNAMIQVLFVLNALLAEKIEEPEMFRETLAFLKRLYREDIIQDTLEDFYKKLLMIGGFVEEAQIAQASFDTTMFIEKLIGKKLTVFY